MTAPGPALVIWGYDLPITGRPRLALPEGARVLSVGPPRDGRDVLDLWVAVDPRNDTLMGRVPRDFRVVGTGHPLPDDCGPFVGTVPTHGGLLVWHVFEALS